MGRVSQWFTPTRTRRGMRPTAASALSYGIGTELVTFSVRRQQLSESA